MQKSGPTTTGAPSSTVCRRLQFDVEDDTDVADHQKSSSESSETVLNYLERLYDDQVARWNMDFRTLTPTNGGRWRWSRVVTSSSLPVDDHVTADDSCSTVSRNIVTRKRKMNGKCQPATSICLWCRRSAQLYTELLLYGYYYYY